MRIATRALYVVSFLALSVGYYYFLGAAPTPSEKAEEIAWWRPLGLARELESEWLAPFQQIAADYEQARHEGRSEPRGLIPLALFAAPPLLLAALGFALFRSAVVRVLAAGLGLTLAAFSYYGWLDAETWQDYSWRWPAVLLSTGLALAAFALAPALVRAARRRSAAFQLACVAVVVVAVYFLSIEVTGTNPRLQWNLSPWPTLTLYGFLLFGLMLGVIHVAAGVGLLVRGEAAGAGRAALAAALAGGLAAALHRIPFASSGLMQVLPLALPAALLAVAAGRRGDARAVAASFLVAGALLLGSIKLGQWQGEFFQTRSRDEIAPRVIAALERYREERGSYPDELVNLVPEYLPEIPLPRVGWFDSPDETFLYTYLGDSFLLEFPSIVWVQCAYSPPYREVFDDEEEEEPEEAAPGGDGGAGAGAGEREVLEASWSCESKPPRLW